MIEERQFEVLDFYPPIWSVCILMIMLTTSLAAFSSPIPSPQKQAQLALRHQSKGLAVQLLTSNQGGIQFGNRQRQASQQKPLDVVDPLTEERPYGCRFRFLGRLLERVTSEARRDNYEFNNLPAPQLWINIAARAQRELTVLEAKYAKQMNQLTDEIVNQQRLAAFMQRELDIYQAAKDSDPEASPDPERSERLMSHPSDSVEIEIEFHQRGLGIAQHDAGILIRRKQELQELFRQQFVEASQSLAILESQFEQMTGKTLRNPRKEYRTLLMNDERTALEEARFIALTKEIWGENLITDVADVAFGQE